MPSPFAVVALLPSVVLALALMLPAPRALAVTIGPAVTGTLLDDPSSSFTVEVMDAGGTSFGTVGLLGNSISLTPTAFSVGPTEGVASGALTGSILLALRPRDPATIIAAVHLNEIGDYWAAGPGPTAQLGAAFTLDARALGGSGPASTTTADTGPLAVTGLFGLTTWQLAGNLRADEGPWRAVAGGGVLIGLENRVYWDLAAGEAGFLQKKDAGVGLQVSVVPLPATAWLLLGGLGLVFGAAQRRTVDGRSSAPLGDHGVPSARAARPDAR